MTAVEGWLHGSYLHEFLSVTSLTLWLSRASKGPWLTKDPQCRCLAIKHYPLIPLEVHRHWKHHMAKNGILDFSLKNFTLLPAFPSVSGTSSTKLLEPKQWSLFFDSSLFLNTPQATDQLVLLFCHQNRFQIQSLLHPSSLYQAPLTFKQISHFLSCSPLPILYTTARVNF